MRCVKYTTALVNKMIMIMLHSLRLCYQSVKNLCAIYRSAGVKR